MRRGLGGGRSWSAMIVGCGECFVVGLFCFEGFGSSSLVVCFPLVGIGMRWCACWMLIVIGTGSPRALTCSASRCMLIQSPPHLPLLVPFLWLYIALYSLESRFVSVHPVDLFFAPLGSIALSALPFYSPDLLLTCLPFDRTHLKCGEMAPRDCGAPRGAPSAVNGGVGSPKAK